MVQVGLLTNGEWRLPGTADERAQPQLLELHMDRLGRQLQWIESRRQAVLERQVLPAQGTHQDLQAPVLVDDDLCHALALEYRERETDQHRLARSAIRIRRIARMQ